MRTTNILIGGDQLDPEALDDQRMCVGKYINHRYTLYSHYTCSHKRICNKDDDDAPAVSPTCWQCMPIWCAIWASPATKHASWPIRPPLAFLPLLTSKTVSKHITLFSFPTQYGLIPTCLSYRHVLACPSQSLPDMMSSSLLPLKTYSLPRSSPLSTCAFSYSGDCYFFRLGDFLVCLQLPQSQSFDTLSLWIVPLPWNNVKHCTVNGAISYRWNEQTKRSKAVNSIVYYVDKYFHSSLY